MLGEDPHAQHFAGGRIHLPPDVSVVHVGPLEILVSTNVFSTHDITAGDGRQLAILGSRKRPRAGKAELLPLGELHIQRERRKEVVPILRRVDRRAERRERIHLEVVPFVPRAADQPQCGRQRNLGHHERRAQSVARDIRAALRERPEREDVRGRRREAAVEDLFERQRAIRVADIARTEGI